MQKFIDCKVEPAVSYDTSQLEDQELQDIVHASRWGSKYTDLFLQWISTLQWPDPEHERDDGDPGISWLELMINFELQTQCSIPLQCGQDGEKYYRHYEDILGWTRDQCSLHDVLYSFQGSFSHIEQLANTELIPSALRGKVKSIYQLGAGAGHRGLTTRPQMHCQEATMNLLSKFLEATRLGTNNSRLTHLPNIPEREACFTARFAVPAEVNLRDRRHRLKQRLKAVQSQDSR